MTAATSTERARAFRARQRKDKTRLDLWVYPEDAAEIRAFAKRVTADTESTKNRKAKP